jgi:GAF domain-containing protein
LPVYDPRVLPFLLIAALLLLQFVITLVRLPIERALFYGADRRELRRLQTLEERLLTTRDLNQFFESALAALCDALASPSAFLAAFGPDGKIESEVAVGAATRLREQGALPPLADLHAATDVAGLNGQTGLFPAGLFAWGDYWIVPLRTESSGEPLGLLGVQMAQPGRQLSADEAAIVSLLAGRIGAALEDRRLQQDVFQALDRLLPEIDALQRLRASAAYLARERLTGAEAFNAADLPQIIKDALRDYWGGPRLTNSPLLRLRVVERALAEHDGNAVNALRAVLREAVERIRPEGQRKFTAEWLLYNILELKFLQGQKVRDVATRLAVSEADLYRKQRVALEELAQSIVAMEREAGGAVPSEA